MASTTNDATNKRDSFLGDGYAFERTRTRSSPEKKAKRGTPKRAVTHVAEKHEKPIKNIYGEDQMPSDNNQRLQQCVIFLSDEGPESYPNFTYQLKKLEHEIGHVWPQKKRQSKKFVYDEHLYRKVKAMMRVQRARVDNGARLWFEQTMFPEYAPSASEAETEYPPAAPRLPVTRRGKGHHGHHGHHGHYGHHGDAAKLAEAQRQADEATKALQARDKADADLKAADDAYDALAKDPWAQDMPRPEIWHRNMPNSFPFGETPYMEREMSKQISRDLGENILPPRSWLQGVVGRFWGANTDDDTPPATWALPLVTDEEVHSRRDSAVGVKKRSRGAAQGGRGTQKRQRRPEDVLG